MTSENSENNASNHERKKISHCRPIVATYTQAADTMTAKN